MRLLDFIITIRSNSLLAEDYNDWVSFKLNSNYNLYYPNDPQFIINIDSITAIAFGDPIYFRTEFENSLRIFNKDNDVFQIVKKLKGFYYLIVIDNENDNFFVFSSFLGILPVYYTKDFISNSIKAIKNNFNSTFSLNKQFVLEKILFYYSISNTTILNEINLLPSNTYFFVNKHSFEIRESISVWDFFIDHPVGTRKIREYLAEKFIDVSSNYFPSEKSMIAFTSGFDGRSIVASALHHKKNFSTFSFGKPTYDDITIPSRQAEKLGFNHERIILDNEYLSSSAFQCSKQFVEINEGNSDATRAHYLYAAKRISAKYDYVINGNFGSEIFRSINNFGVMFNERLFKLLEAEETVSSLFHRYYEHIFDIHKFKNEINYLQEFIESSPYHINSGRSINQRIYSFYLNEVFRKYFGPEIIAQFNYLKPRSPFLDPEFIIDLQKTLFSAAYTKAFEKNPIKRMRGQTIYAEIIRKTCYSLYEMTTGKGYSPKDINTFWGKLNLLNNYLRKHRNISIDPFLTNSNLVRNFELFKKWQNATYFVEFENLDELYKKLNSKLDIFNYISLNYTTKVLLN